MSRKTDYKTSYCKELIEHMKSGHTLASFAFKVNVARSTLYNWIKQYSEFREAYEIGYSAALYYHEILLNEGMKGTCSNIEGSKGINSNLLTFALKTRFRDEYSENYAKPLEPTEKELVNGKPLHELTNDELKERLEELNKDAEKNMEMMFEIMYSPDPFA